MLASPFTEEQLEQIKENLRFEVDTKIDRYNHLTGAGLSRLFNRAENIAAITAPVDRLIELAKASEAIKVFCADLPAGYANYDEIVQAQIFDPVKKQVCVLLSSFYTEFEKPEYFGKILELILTEIHSIDEMPGPEEPEFYVGKFNSECTVPCLITRIFSAVCCNAMEYLSEKVFARTVPAIDDRTRSYFLVIVDVVRMISKLTEVKDIIKLYSSMDIEKMIDAVINQTIFDVSRPAQKEFCLALYMIDDLVRPAAATCVMGPRRGMKAFRAGLPPLRTHTLPLAPPTREELFSPMAKILADNSDYAGTVATRVAGDIHAIPGLLSPVF